MNARQAKKIRRMYKKDFQAEAKRQATLLASALKRRPKYFPKWLWRLLAGLFFKRIYLNHLYR